MTKLLLIAIFSVGIDASYYRLRHHERGENDQDIPSNDNITSRGDTRNDISEEEMALIEKLRDSYRRTEDKSKDILERILSGALNNSPREMQLHKDATNRVCDMIEKFRHYQNVIKKTAKVYLKLHGLLRFMLQKGLILDVHLLLFLCSCYIGNFLFFVMCVYFSCLVFILGLYSLNSA